MSIFTKARVRTAEDSRTQMPFLSSHITTADFFQLTCPYIREIVPNQSITIDMSCFSRLAPMPVPTLGRCEIHHHAFFVPFRTIMPSWHDFITDTPHVAFNSDGVGSIVPFSHRLDVRDFVKVLTSYSLYSASGTSTNFDICTIEEDNQNPVNRYYIFTEVGRTIFKLLRQLGYCLDYDIEDRSYEGYTAYVSAMPLLSFVRIYLDWFYPNQYIGDTDYNTLLEILKRDSPAGVTLSYYDIVTIFHYIYRTCYDSDYFTSAFDNPAGPNQGLFSSFNIDDVTLSSANESNKSSVFTDSSGTPVVRKANANIAPVNISQYILDSLHALSDYMKRHQLVGSSAVARYLARFGVKLPENDKSILIGSCKQKMEFGAVMSNASTEMADLGEYAGQGFSNGGKTFSFTSEKDYGFLIITTSIVPVIGYVQGINRHILHMSKLDYFTPEFDALGTQPISKAEVVVDNLNQGQTNGGSELDFFHTKDAIFGFTPRYAEYKIQHDMLTGDFNLPRISTAGISSPAWHTFRMFDDTQNGDAIVHSKAFVIGDYNANDKQYDRIFDNTTGSADHFVLRYVFDVKTSLPAKSLFDTYDFDESHGKVLSIEPGGVNLN